MKRFLSILVLMAWMQMVQAQVATVCGYVHDAQSNERLIGATILDTVTGRGTVTNVSGFYSLTLPVGQHALQVSYVGYHPSQLTNIELAQDTTIRWNLQSSTRLEEVTVVGNKSLSSPESAQMSAIEVPIQQIKNIPAIGGEVDILKAIQLLPGVQSGSEGATGIYVRGGGPDENLIMLDGVPLYNVSHLMGFFSVFNADAVKNVTLYKGNFPAQYGSRLSSVIDVRQNDGNATGYHGNISVGLLSAKVGVEGPIYWHKDELQRFGRGDTVQAKTTFNVSARRTYFDAFLVPIMAAVMRKESGGSESAAAGYYFYDFNAKLCHTFSEKDRLSASFYTGEDALYIRYKTRYTEQDDNNYERMNIGMRMTWGNTVAAVNWEHQVSHKLFANTGVNFTRYHFGITESAEDEMKMEGLPVSFEQSMGYSSYIYDVTARTAFEFTPTHKHNIHFGADLTYHQFRPSVSNFFIATMGNIDPMEIDTTLGGERVHAAEANIYFEDQYAPIDWLKLTLGARASLYGLSGKVYPSIEPRFGLRALLYKGLAFKASYSYTSQYVHMLSNSDVSLPTDLWVPVTSNIPPMRCMQVAGGLSYDICGQVELSVEGYYKKMENLIEYKDGASFFGSSTGWEDKVCVGDGWSYGVELLLQRTIGPVTGWIGYTWSRSMRQFDREGQQINYGRPFHAKYDREHDLSVTLQYVINKKVDLAATFVYGTGTRGTIAKQVYYDPTASDYYNSHVQAIEERNNFQMPDYHRLDLGANFHIPHKRSGDPAKSKGGWLRNAEHVVNISVYNVYCRKNPYLVYTDGYQLYQISIFPILPSLAYSFKF